MKNFRGQSVTFKEAEYGKYFRATPIDQHDSWQADWAAKSGATHMYVSEAGHERALELGATVAHVYTDEDEYGRPVKEKWAIRHICY